MSTAPINMSRVIINDSQIVVESDECSTLWINEKPLSEILGSNDATIIGEALQASYKSLIALAKEKGCKIGYAYGMRRRIEECIDNLPANVDTANTLYEDLRKGWAKKMEKGIFPGYCDDLEVKQLGIAKGLYMSLFYHSATLGQAIDIRNDLTRLTDSVSRGASHIRI